MFGRLFGRHELKAPVSGACVALSEVADPAFAQGMVGPGAAIRPSSCEVASPCDGTIAVLPDTMHAFVVEDDRGTQVLVHVGIDTVELGGRGFSALARKGDRVRAGQPVVAFDEAVMAEAGLDMTVMVVIPEADPARVRQTAVGSDVTAGSDVVCELR